jgi:protein subunit release factor B
MDKIPIFSITKKDFKIEQFKRSSGAGGQKVNKTSSACRITHLETGIMYECHDSRDFLKNRSECFIKVVSNPKFQKWLRVKTAEKLSGETIEEKVERELKNIREEVMIDGTWVQRHQIDLLA